MNEKSLPPIFKTKYLPSISFVYNDDGTISKYRGSELIGTKPDAEYMPEIRKSFYPKESHNDAR